MKDAEAVKLTQEGFELLCSHARIIAMLPLEDWLQALEHAETVGPILDPTLYREYLYSKKPEILKGIIRAAITLKQEVLKAQPVIRDLCKSTSN